MFQFNVIVDFVIMVGFLGECGGLVKRLFIWRKDLVELRGLFVMLLSLLELFVK